MRTLLMVVLVLGLAWLSIPPLGGAGAPGLAEPVVSNVRAGQRPGTIWMDIMYDVEAAGGGQLWVTVMLSEDGGQTYAPPTGQLTGDVGLSVVPGLDKRVVWEPDVSWLGRTVGDLRFRVSARRPPPGMVWIAPGTFTMGSPADEVGRFDDEGPQTEVRISRGYWLGRYEVTQEEWELVMGSDPSGFKDADLPVERVSWEEAMQYCRRLTARERGMGRLAGGWEYRLPTEAQWEYACRAGTRTRYSFGDNQWDLGRYAWYDRNSGGRTHPVGQKEPNGWGLHDMHGNVWEWCLDWWQNCLPGGSVTDPTGPASGSYRVSRGGGWGNEAWGCRSADRSRNGPSDRNRLLGFRVALVQVP